MSLIKTKKEIVVLREAGRRLAVILRKVADAVQVGVKSSELNSLAERLIREGGDVPAFLNYTPALSHRPFPASLCLSVNDEIVHGIPNEVEKVIKDGDIVGLDLGLQHAGLFVDMAVSVGVGKIDEKAKKLLEDTHRALMKGIETVKPGGHIGDIGAVIEKIAKKEGYGLVRELGGHGVGHAVHEMPYIPNWGRRGQDKEIKEQMVLAIEPMFNEGGDDIILNKDGYTYQTKDASRSAHFEHTIVVTKTGADIVTVE